MIQKILLLQISFLIIFNFNSSGQSKIAETPDWAKRAVWYQIFPERFSNGDKNNDPTENDIIGAWPHEKTSDWKTSSWNGDWYELQSWEKNGKGFYYHLQQRRYGGDLQGVINKLNYLSDLGINAIYLNPIFESPSLHKYDAAFYHHIDNNFGPTPELDVEIWNGENPEDEKTWQWTGADKLFLELINQAHKKNIKIIIDGVFNHTGMNFWALQDLKKNGENSKYKNWYTIKKYDNPSTTENEFEYEGWYGIRELPEIKEDSNGIVDGPKNHIFKIVKRWMDPNGDGNPDDGIDGWRLDVADMVSNNYWKDFRKFVREINPDAYLVGEVWWEDWNIDKMRNAEPWLRGDVFDAVMNYRWARECVYYFAADKTKIDEKEFANRIQNLLSEYRTDANLVLLNLFDSHDTDRLASRVVNSDLKFDKKVGLTDNPDYKIAKPNSEEMEKIKLMAFFQMMSVGAPCIYYGTESGMWGGDDPDCRKPMNWNEIKFSDEKNHPFGNKRTTDKNIFNSDLFNWYKNIISLRKSHTSLFDSNIKFYDSEDGILIFQRWDQNEKLFIVINNSNEMKNIKIPLLDEFNSKKNKLIFGQCKYEFSKNQLSIEISKKSGVVFNID